MTLKYSFFRLRSLVQKIRRTEACLGSALKQPTAVERDNAVDMRRSVVASRDIRKGEVIKEKDLTFKRPATGLSPVFYDSIIGKRAVMYLVPGIVDGKAPI